MINIFCTLCNRPMDMEGDDLSLSCGEDCWGCVREIETGTLDPRPREPDKFDDKPLQTSYRKL